jgi:hypothetical protein
MIATTLPPDASEDDYADAISSQLEIRQDVHDSGAWDYELVEQEVSLCGDEEHYPKLRGRIRTGLGPIDWRAKLVKVVGNVGIYHVEPVD